jgi:hypothetical protein
MLLISKYMIKRNFLLKLLLLCGLMTGEGETTLGDDSSTPQHEVRIGLPNCTLDLTCFSIRDHTAGSTYS